GVPSRMNVGQILEVHLGWAGYLLGKQLQKMVDAKVAPDKLRSHLGKILHKGDPKDFLGELNEKDLAPLAKKFKNGFFFATPVFDGTHESEIKNMLTLANVHTNGQTVLFDGRTGEAFDRDVTVGVMYILKL